MESFLKTYGSEIQGVYGHNDEMVLGAIEAIKEAGLKSGVDIVFPSTGSRELKPGADIKLISVVECIPLLGDQVDDGFIRRRSY